MGEDSNTGEENTAIENVVIAEIRKREGTSNTCYHCNVYVVSMSFDEEVKKENGRLVIVDSETGASRLPITGYEGEVLLTDLVLSATQASRSKAPRKINQALAREGYGWRIKSTGIYQL